MLTPEDAKTVVADATADYPAIVGAPTDDDMKKLTEFLSNNAVAVLYTPIAIQLAHQLGVDPRPFVVAVMFRRPWPLQPRLAIRPI